MKKAYVRMIATIQLFVLTMVFCGTPVFSSCNSEDKYSVENEIKIEPDCQKAIDNILQGAKVNMEVVDFKDLKSLADSLRNGTAKVNCPEFDNTKIQQAIASLQSMLDCLFKNKPQTAPCTSWNLSDLSETLLSAINAAKALENDADSPLLVGHKYSISLNVVLNDTLSYTITSSKERRTDLSVGEIGNEIHRQLSIGKNGTTLLAINTNQNFDASVKDNSIIATRLRSGSLDYKDMKFSLSRSLHNTDSVVSNLVYTKGNCEVIAFKMKGENNLTLESILHRNVVFKGELVTSINDGTLALKCNVANMNKFYIAGLGLAQIAITGSPKEKCQKLSDEFNTVVNSTLSLFGNELGLVMIEPIAWDSVPNTYHPGLVLQPLPIDEDSEKIILKDFLNMLGLSFEDIINMLIG